MRRRYKSVLWVVLACLVGSQCIPLLQRKSMKLIHKNTGFTVVEIQKNTVHIKDPFLEKQLKLKGIAIPEFLRPEYNGKPVITMDDPLFSKAFTEVYLPLYLGENSYEWKQEGFF